MHLSKRLLPLLSLAGGILLSAAWPPYGFAGLVFIAFIPLLLVEYISSQREYSAGFVFLNSIVAFLTWNALSVWWVWNASAEGAIMAILTNTLLMSITFQLFHAIKNKLRKQWGDRIKGIEAFFFIPVWVAFEYLHHTWQLSFPWMSIGNVFAKTHTWIQWYEFTGIFGGAIWALLINILSFQLLFIKGFTTKRLIVIIASILFPILISFGIYYSYKEIGIPVNVVVVQPNIDPYNDKFNAPIEEQVDKMLGLAEAKVNDSTDYIIFPETALQEGIWESKIKNTASYHYLKKYLEAHPDISIICGASTYKLYEENETPSLTARKFNQQDRYYDAYNTALQLDQREEVQMYHKSKLVPGVEKMPYPALFKFLEDYALDLGGIVGSLGEQKERANLVNKNNNIKVAPVICYESVFGAYLGKYISNGANLISIITNDGWWGDTPGYKQHLLYAKLRAIENRRSIARSANTGISAFIDQRGDVHQATRWWEEVVISQTILANDAKTFYTNYGDVLAKICKWLFYFLFAHYLLLRFGVLKKS